MTRDEHVAWCRERALAELDGDHTRYRAPEVRLANALASLASDLRKHPDTDQHAGIELGMRLAVAGHLESEQQMREWIDGIR